jgi:hypothetical protein
MVPALGKLAKEVEEVVAASRKKKQRRAGGIPSILSTKRLESNLLFANQVIWGT